MDSGFPSSYTSTLDIQTDMIKVTILEKKEGQTWSLSEMTILNNSGVETEKLGAKPHRLVAMNKPTNASFETVLAGITFTSREVDYGDRWL